MIEDYYKARDSEGNKIPIEGERERRDKLIIKREKNNLATSNIMTMLCILHSLESQNCGVRWEVNSFGGYQTFFIWNINGEFVDDITIQIRISLMEGMPCELAVYDTDWMVYYTIFENMMNPTIDTKDKSVLKLERVTKNKRVEEEVYFYLTGKKDKGIV